MGSTDTEKSFGKIHPLLLQKQMQSMDTELSEMIKDLGEESAVMVTRHYESS
jgi:hypothetical protein